MNFFQDLDFIWWRFFTLLFISILAFKWLGKKNWRTKLYFSPFILFPFIYAGIGGAWKPCNTDYIWKYGLYILTFSLSCYYFQKHYKRVNPKIFSRNNQKLEIFINRYGTITIYIYISLKILSVLLDGRIVNVIHPPEMDMSAAFENTLSNDGGSSVINYLENIIYVLYIVSLYKYRKNYKTFAFYLLLPVYLTYVDSAYLGRGTIMLTFINLIIGYVYCYPKRMKLTLITIAIGVPFIIFSLVWYSTYRIGADSAGIDISKALKVLSYQETSYPLHYNQVKNWNFDWEICYAYLYWIVTLPLPGFMKSNDVDYYFNYIFSEKINGIGRNLDGFSVSLPGLVNEGIMVFGPTFFLLHAVILGFFVGKAFKWVKYRPELFLYIHCCFNVAYSVSRGGTGSQYSFYLKNLLIYLIIRFFILHRNKYNQI